MSDCSFFNAMQPEKQAEIYLDAAKQSAEYITENSGYPARVVDTKGDEQ